MRRVLLLLLALAVFLPLLLPLNTQAAPPLDIGHACSLTVIFSKDGYAFTDVPAEIYRVAKVYPNGNYGLIPPFSTFPVNIHGIKSQQEWKNVASTLSAYVQSQQIPADHTVLSDPEGRAAFEDLETGLYLVLGKTAENDKGIYVFEDFMIYLPTPADGGYDYDMEARPKPAQFTPKTEYTVKKLWKDSASSASRPGSVTVDILKNGNVQETVVLNAGNNWSYTWSVPESTDEWTVVEKDVPNRYKVTITSDGGVFTITNTAPSDPQLPPKTGDTVFPLPYILGMCLSGFLMILLSSRSRRKAG